VPEYDAFGREIGENTLEGLGGDSRSASPPSETAGWEASAEAVRAQAAAQEQAARDATDAAEAAATPRPSVFDTGDAPPAQVTRTRAIPRSIGCLFSLIVLGVVFGGIALAVVGIWGAARDAIDDVADTIDAPALRELQTPTPAPEPPSGIGGDSLIAPGNLERVLGELGGHSAGQLVVRPDRVAAELFQGGRGRLVQVSADGSVFRSDPQPITGERRRLDLRDIDVRAPTRLVRRSAARFKVRPEGIDYLIASPDFTNPRAHHWVAYFKNGVYVQGDASGRVERRIQ
jgi:hypothetical protein